MKFAVFSSVMGAAYWPDSLCDSESEAVGHLGKARMRAAEEMRRMGLPHMVQPAMDLLYVAPIMGDEEGMP